MALTVDIVGPDRVLWKGEASFVSAPSVEGSIGLKPRHEPLLAVLQHGTVKVVELSGAEQFVQIVDGFISFDHDTVTIVATPVTPASE